MRTTLYVLDRDPFVERYHALPCRMPAARWRELLAAGAARSELGELIAELPAQAALEQDGLVSVSGSGCRLVLEVCKVECALAAYQIAATDFFFADLEANPPDPSGLGEPARQAWSTFARVVNTSGEGRSELPEWLRHAARAGCAFAGLLTPAEVTSVSERCAELVPWLRENVPDGSQRDAEALLALVSQAAVGQHWVLGWEPGT